MSFIEACPICLGHHGPDDPRALYTGAILHPGDCPRCGADYPHCDCWHYEELQEDIGEEISSIQLTGESHPKGNLRVVPLGPLTLMVELQTVEAVSPTLLELPPHNLRRLGLRALAMRVSPTLTLMVGFTRSRKQSR